MTETLPDTPTERRRPVPRTGLYRLGAGVASRPLRVLALWVVALAGLAVSAGYFTGHLTANANTVIGSDSAAADRLLERTFPDAPAETDFVVLHSTTLTARDPAYRARVEAVVTRFRASPDVADVTDPDDAPTRLVSGDGRTVLVPVGLDGDPSELQRRAERLGDLAEQLSTEPVRVYFTGSAPLSAAAVERSSADLSRAESIGLPAAAVVLVLAFGSIVAAAIPLVLGIVAVVGAFGVLGGVALFASFDVFVQTAVSMIGIALGIDYSLFIVTRFREELAHAADDGRAERAAAVGRTLATAGRAVLFSGFTVVVSLAGLVLVRSAKVYAMAAGMAAAVAVMMTIAVTLLPAVLGLLGPRINRWALPWARRSLAHPDPDHSVWARIASGVMRRPGRVASVTTVLLVALSLPFFSLRYGVDEGLDTVRDTPAAEGYAVVSESFAPGITAPVSAVVTSGDRPLTDVQLTAIDAFADEVAADPSVAEVVALPGVLDTMVGGHRAAQLSAALTRAGPQLEQLVDDGGRTTVVTIRPRDRADTEQAAELVRNVRHHADARLAEAGLTAHVGGAPAQLVDITDESTRAMPLVISAVLAASWVLLLFVFRSLLLPFKAVLMNLFTSGAAFGAAVLVFQEGHGAGLLGVERTGFLLVILPLFAFALVFGLSMDYEVFMLTRMREEWLATGDNVRSVQLGITRTARVITAAATIMVVVFASFMLTRNLEIKQMGFMLGLAVLIDASIVRLLLVPALMRLMGRWNWWMPGWLDRLLPGRAYQEP